jgi:hypothetical protein
MAASVEIVFAGLVLFCLDCPTNYDGKTRDQALVVDASGNDKVHCGQPLTGRHVPTITYFAEDEDFVLNGLPVERFVDAQGRWTARVTLQGTSSNLCFKMDGRPQQGQADCNLNRKFLNVTWSFSRFNRFGWIAGLEEVDADASPKMNVNRGRIKFSVDMGSLMLGTKQIATYPSGANEGERIRWNFGGRPGREIAELAFAVTPSITTLALADCEAGGETGEKEYVRIKARRGSQLTIANLPPDDGSVHSDLSHFRWYYYTLDGAEEACDVPVMPRDKQLYGVLAANTFCPVGKTGG